MVRFSWSTRCPFSTNGRRFEWNASRRVNESFCHRRASDRSLYGASAACAPHACHFLSPAEQVWNITRVDLLGFEYCEPEASFRYNSTKYPISNECSVEVSFRDINDFVCVCSVFLLHGRSDWRVPGGFFSVPWAFTSFHCATKGLTFDTVPECGRSRPLHIRVIAYFALSGQLPDKDIGMPWSMFGDHNEIFLYTGSRASIRLSFRFGVYREGKFGGWVCGNVRRSTD
jgi:hypothetical protein